MSSRRISSLDSRRSRSRRLRTIVSGEASSFHSSECDILFGSSVQSTTMPESGSSASSGDSSYHSDAYSLSEDPSLRDDDETEAVTTTTNPVSQSTMSSTSTGSPWIDVSDSSSEDFSEDEEGVSTVDYVDGTIHSTHSRTTTTTRSVTSIPSSTAPSIESVREEEIKVLATKKAEMRALPPRPVNHPGVDLNRFPKSRLLHVAYVRRMEVASTNNALSTVEPGISPAQAKDAFMPEVPRVLKVNSDEDDDVSSLGGGRSACGYQKKRKKSYKERKPPVVRKLDPVDEESGTLEEIQRVLNKQSLLSRYSKIEIFFAALITVSVIILVVLIGVVVARK